MGLDGFRADAEFGRDLLGGHTVSNQVKDFAFPARKKRERPFNRRTRGSHLLDDFALAYLGFGPIEVVMVTLTPILVAQGHGWPLAAVALAAALLVFFLLPYYQRRMRIVI